MLDVILKGTWQTLYMVFFSTYYSSYRPINYLCDSFHRKSI